MGFKASDGLLQGAHPACFRDSLSDDWTTTILLTGLETVYPGSLGMTTRPGILAAALSPRGHPPALNTCQTFAGTVQQEAYVAARHSQLRGQLYKSLWSNLISIPVI